MQASPVIERIKAQVPQLRSVDGAIELVALLDARIPLAPGPVAHVVPTGIRGGAAEAMSGAFVQAIEDVVNVIVSFRSIDDATGRKSVDMVSDLLNDVICAIAGWGPDDALGVFRLVRCSVLRFDAGILVYGIEFAISDQLRILT